MCAQITHAIIYVNVKAVYVISTTLCNVHEFNIKFV
jgi:hypothetical protein